MNGKNSIDAKIQRADQLLVRVETPKIKTMILEYGYSDQRLLEGRRLYDSAKNLIEVQKLKKLEQYQITESFHRGKNKINREFRCIVSLARRTLSSTQIDELGLQGPIAENYEPWVTTVDYFCKACRANDDILSLFKPWGIDKEKLTQLDTLVFDLRQLKVKQKDAFESSQIATENKNTALKELRYFISSLAAICRMAFRGETKILEYLL